jgi:hypothetical protein
VKNYYGPTVISDQDDNAVGDHDSDEDLEPSSRSPDANEPGE